MRKLASIQRIEKLEPIENADAILKATVLNWSLVTAKTNGFKEGDLIIFIEPDAFIPHDLAPFLTKPGHPVKEYNGVKGERLRTIKLRGQISQGLILPVAGCFGDTVTISAQNATTFKEGDDVTEALGIQKYEPPVAACLGGMVKGNWPDGVPKTDEDRIQSFSNKELFNLRQINDFYVEEKLDGSSCTVGFKNGEFIVCSRNLNLTETESNSFWKTARTMNLEALIKNTGRNLVIQSELVGEDIQGNKYKLKGQMFYAFYVFDCDSGEYLGTEEKYRLLKQLGVPMVPQLGQIKLQNFKDVNALLDFAEGKSKLYDTEREGIVLKSIDGKTHFKAISRKFLIKNEE